MGGGGGIKTNQTKGNYKICSNYYYFILSNSGHLALEVRSVEHNCLILEPSQPGLVKFR